MSGIIIHYHKRINRDKTKLRRNKTRLTSFWPASFNRYSSWIDSISFFQGGLRFENNFFELSKDDKWFKRDNSTHQHKIWEVCLTYVDIQEVSWKTVSLLPSIAAILLQLTALKLFCQSKALADRDCRQWTENKKKSVCIKEWFVECTDLSKEKHSVPLKYHY